MQIDVTPEGLLRWPGGTCRCALGRGGRRPDKREGDGATPIGRFPLRRVHYRPDRLPSPASGLPVRALSPDDGWCDAPDHAQYNTLVALPFEASHEILWRNDHLYDLIVEIGYNDAPATPNKGSAIFLHVAQPDYDPTEGCVAIARDDLVPLVGRLDADSTIVIHPPA